MKNFLIGLFVLVSLPTYAGSFCGVVEQVIKHHVTRVSGEEIDILAVSLLKEAAPLKRNLLVLSYSNRKEDRLIRSQLDGLKVCVLNDQVYFDKL